MKKVTAIFTALITALSIGSCFVSAADISKKDAALFDDVLVECAKGQTLHIPIYISANNDFESAEFKLIYGQGKKSKKSDQGITINNVKLENTAIAMSWHDFKDEGYARIIMYRGGAAAVDDGVAATIELTVNEDAGEFSHELKLIPVLFATVNGGERETNEASITIESNKILGDPNDDGVVNVRDAAKISMLLSRGAILPIWADYNGDGVVNVRDCAAIARDCAKHIVR